MSRGIVVGLVIAALIAAALFTYAPGWVAKVKGAQVQHTSLMVRA